VNNIAIKVTIGTGFGPLSLRFPNLIIMKTDVRRVIIIAILNNVCIQLSLNQSKSFKDKTNIKIRLRF
jgi:hypothetical protein